MSFINKNIVVYIKSFIMNQLSHQIGQIRSIINRAINLSTCFDENIIFQGTPKIFEFD